MERRSGLLSGLAVAVVVVVVVKKRRGEDRNCRRLRKSREKE